MKKAVIYGRVSSKDDRQNYDRQINDLVEYSKNHDFEIVKTFSEKVSASKTKQDERTEFNAMLSFIEGNKIKHILVTELSRIGRSGVYTQLMIEQLKQKGVNVFIQKEGLHTFNEDGSLNINADMWIAIRSQMDKQETESLKFRVKSGLKNAAKNNTAIYGVTPPYGFKIVEKKLIKDPEEIEIIKEIYDQYEQGNGTFKIVNYLNNKGVKTRYHKVFGERDIKTKSGGVKKGTEFIWKPISVQQILKNKIYLGERWFQGELVGTFEPIIDRTRFNNVQVIMKNNTNKTNKIKNTNHLKDIVKCLDCGQTMQMKKVEKTEKYNGISQYTCIGKIEKKCKSISIGIERLEVMLFNAFNYEILKSIKSQSKKEVDKIIQSKEMDVFNIESTLKRYESRLNKLYDSYDKDSITQSIFETRKKDLDLENVENQKKIDVLKNEILNYKSVTGIKNIYSKVIFLENIKSIIKLIQVGAVEKNFLNKVKEFGKHAQQVKITTLTGAVFNVFQSRYKDNYILSTGNGKGTMFRQLKFSTEEKEIIKTSNEKLMIAPMFDMVDKLVKQKMKS